MTRQVALGAIIGFAVTVLVTAIWPRSAPPLLPDNAAATVDPNGVVHVNQLLPLEPVQPIPFNAPPSNLQRPVRAAKPAAPAELPVALP